MKIVCDKNKVIYIDIGKFLKMVFFVGKRCIESY